MFKERSVPTPASVPAAILHDGVDLWFTELEGNRIGRMDRDLGGVITEYTIPTPNSGPTSIVMNGRSRLPLLSAPWRIARISLASGPLAGGIS